MGGLQVLIWIFCVVISINSLNDEQLLDEYRSISTEYRIVQDKMLELKREITFEFTRLANKTSIELDKRETKRLEGYSGCFQTWMKRIRTKIGSSMIEQFPAPCSNVWIQMLEEIDEKMTRQDTGIGANLDRIQECINNTQDCTSNRELRGLREEVIRSKREWSQYERRKFLRDWRKMTNCYHSLSVVVEEELIKFSEFAGRCGSITYEQFLGDIGLVPVSVHRLIGPSIDSLTIREPPLTTDITYLKKSKLLRILNSLQTSIQEYVNVTVASEMNSVINSSLFEVSGLLRSISRLPVSNEYQSCYVQRIERIYGSIEIYYNSHLQRICFYGLLSAMDEFEKIAKCDLEKYKEQLSGIRNCWADEEICEPIALKLQKLDTSLKLWMDFDLSPAMNNATRCYFEAQSMMHRTIMRSIDDLQKCETISILYIYNNFTNDAPAYPPYQRSELCSHDPVK